MYQYLAKDGYTRIIGIVQANNRTDAALIAMARCRETGYTFVGLF